MTCTILLQELVRRGQQHGLRAHAGQPHEKVDEDGPARAARHVRHDVGLDREVTSSIAHGGVYDRGGDGERQIDETHGENALYGHSEGFG